MRRAITGLRAWLVQRVSAVYMLFFIVFLLVYFLFDPPNSYLDWHDWMLSPKISIAASVFFVALFAHAWVGVRDVILDYIHAIAVRVFMLAALGLGLVGAGAWVTRILWLGHG